MPETPQDNLIDIDIRIHEGAPSDPTDFMQARAWAVQGLLYGPERQRRAMQALQIHKDQEAEAERDLKRRKAQLLLDLGQRLATAGTKTNAEQRDAMLQDDVARDPDCARFEERLAQTRQAIARDQIELAYQDNVNGNARSLARLLSTREAL